MKCRICGNSLKTEFIDLVNSPPSNSFLLKEQLNEPEVFYPLKLYVCNNCFLVQIEEYKKSTDIFNEEYAYFSSFSDSWLKHCKDYCDKITGRFNLDNKSMVIEIASNDGYLLQFFKEKGIPVLGIEPTKNTATVAIQKGIDTIIDFFGAEMAKSLLFNGFKADLIVGNNVFAHVPDLNDFTEGLKTIMKSNGLLTLEFPHLMRLIENNQFDTIYHEHFSYFSLLTVMQVFKRHDLEIFDVEELSTHGGSLRIFGKHLDDFTKPVSRNVQSILNKECSIGMNSMDYYKGFQAKVNKIKYNLLSCLIELKNKNKKVIAYGAAAKGNSLINYCGIKKDLINFVVDRSPYKQGKYLPASHIPVVNEEEIKKYKPDYVLILPWNLKEELFNQLKYIREWGGKFIIPIPKLEIS